LVHYIPVFQDGCSICLRKEITQKGEIKTVF
jgi:hypothetical protein